MSEPIGAPEPEPARGAILRQRRSIEEILALANVELYRRMVDGLADRSWAPDAWVGVGVGKGGRIVAFLDRDEPAEFYMLRAEFDPDRTLLDYRAVGGIVPAAAPGDSIGAGFVGGMSGTLGCLVTCNVTGATMALTNDHVVGTLASRVAGDDVWSPGSARGGTVRSVIGQFDRGSTVTFGGAANTTDAALATLWHPAQNTAALPYGVTPKRVATKVNLGDTGHKYGVSTGYSSGDLIFIASFLVPYSAGTALFTNQFVFDGGPTPFAQLGDSGALVYSDKDEAIGLLFAAAPANNLGFVNPMAEVLNAINASL